MINQNLLLLDMHVLFSFELERAQRLASSGSRKAARHLDPIFARMRQSLSPSPSLSSSPASPGVASSSTSDAAQAHATTTESSAKSKKSKFSNIFSSSKPITSSQPQNLATGGGVVILNVKGGGKSKNSPPSLSGISVSDSADGDNSSISSFSKNGMDAFLQPQPFSFFAEKSLSPLVHTKLFSFSKEVLPPRVPTGDETTGTGSDASTAPLSRGSKGSKGSKDGTCLDPWDDYVGIDTEALYPWAANPTIDSSCCTSDDNEESENTLTLNAWRCCRLLTKAQSKYEIGSFTLDDLRNQVRRILRTLSLTMKRLRSFSKQYSASDVSYDEITRSFDKSKQSELRTNVAGLSDTGAAADRAVGLTGRLQHAVYILHIGGLLMMYRPQTGLKHVQLFGGTDFLTYYDTCKFLSPYTQITSSGTFDDDGESNDDNISVPNKNGRGIYIIFIDGLFLFFCD